MLISGVENEIFGMITMLVAGGLILLHYLLFKEYFRQEKIQIQRLKDLEYLVKQEIHRSQSLTNSVFQLKEINENTDEKLEVIKLQVKSIDLLLPKFPLSNQGDK